MATGRMATVRQSITALYEESQKSALEGAPMLAILQSVAVEPGLQPAAIAPATITPAEVETGEEAGTLPIAARFDELRRLAELEAASDRARHAGDTVTETDSLTGSDLTAGFAPPSETAFEPFAESPSGTAPDEQAGSKDMVPDVPIIEIPSSLVGDAPDPATPADMAHDDDSRDAAPDDTDSISMDRALPDEPPAPAPPTGEALGDLDIGDIQDLVRQAWEDETAIGDAARASATPPAPETTSAAPVDTAHDPALSGGIEMAMEEIAAAVVQSADTSPSVDVEAMKADIIGAMRAELQAVVESDLRVIVKAAVAEAMAEMPVAIPAATPKKAPARKAAAKKAVAKKAARKSAAKKATAPDEGGDG